MSSTECPCGRIERVVANMVRRARISCSQQFDTNDFLVTVELRQSVRTFRLTRTEYQRSDWDHLLYEAINKWLSRTAA